MRHFGKILLDRPSLLFWDSRSKHRARIPTTLRQCMCNYRKRGTLDVADLSTWPLKMRNYVQILSNRALIAIRKVLPFLWYHRKLAWWSMSVATCDDSFARQLPCAKTRDCRSDDVNVSNGFGSKYIGPTEVPLLLCTHIHSDECTRRERRRQPTPIDAVQTGFLGDDKFE